ncbi:hypothetical protein DICSQDRAFT_129594 [Dichomitus squalens LYAD-421 SS1]|uniref:Uncharacterized protein n=1 Tax=Dichomitus squalens (strain LYAD-421) TaxID=732165 RepID=R7SQN9_DICSQ|nr:uncharacterized protein DICSQDRAFT_129594 [Dichomitus squalens LYAD-421 SS1]EJF57272.1 hypothetical protein DICSQDRAFT_129594 [Dichomitus squalens LYAD-421 SS1]
MAQVRLEDAAVKRIGDISVKTREAIRASLPTGKEQYLHVMVPGKVVDFNDYTVDKENDVLILTKVELKQAILCDDMPMLSPIQMGPSGRSVSRSYANTISKLIPAGTTVGVDEGKPLTDDQQRYKQAMSSLSAEVGDKDMTLVELYTQKQAAYTRACAEKTRAFAEALEKATNSTKSAKAARQRYDQWVQENAKTWRNYVQAAYMDWVIMGRKEEVEYWFSVVDQESAMARVEQSKEIMRWAIVQDEDGGAEYQKVKLAPSHWANLAKEKANRGINNTKTVEWYTWEINRLEKTIELLELMKKKTVQPAGAPGSDAPDNEIEAQYKGAKTELSKPNKDESKDAWDGRKREAEGKYTSSQTALKKAQSAYDDANLAKLHMDGRKAQEKLLDDLAGDEGFAAVEIQRHKRTIEEYTRARAALMNQTGAKSAEIEKIATSVGIPAAMPDPTAVAAVESPDYFTPITVEVTSTSESKSSSSSASSMSFGASGSYGLFFTGSVSHESSEAHSEATQELANAAVKISFECMRVDITRPWLRPELFYDDDLQSLIRISPGFGRLRALMDSDPQLNMTEGQIASELAGYSIFPVFPTAFLLACNVVLEISGSTSKLQTYMNGSSSSTSVAVRYGPFVAGKANHSSSSANQGSSCDSTASGCRITMKSPQVIGWISQMVPALPRVSAPNEVAAAPHT